MVSEKHTSKGVEERDSSVWEEQKMEWSRLAEPFTVGEESEKNKVSFEGTRSWRLTDIKGV